MKRYLKGVLVLLPVIAQVALSQAEQVSAQSIDIVACDWSQARGVHLDGVSGDLVQASPPEVEQQTRVTVNCRLTVRGVVSQGSQFVVSTHLTEPRWEITTSQGTDRPIESSVRLPLADANIILEGLGPSAVHTISDDLGLDKQVAKRTPFTLLDIGTESGGNQTPFQEFGATALHPETVRVELLMANLGSNSSPRQVRVVQRAEQLLSEGYPAHAAAVLDDLRELEEAEAQLAGSQRWRWVLLGVGLVVGGGIGGVAGYIVRGILQKPGDEPRVRRGPRTRPTRRTT